MPFGFSGADANRLVSQLKATTQQIGGQVADAYREAVPANYRILASTVLGDRSPITEKNFAPSEIAALRKLVSADQAYLPTRAAHQRQMAPVWGQLAADKQRQLAAVQGIGRDLTPDEALKYGVAYDPRKPTTPRGQAVADLSADLQHAQQMRAQAQNVARRASQGVGAIKYDAPDQMSLDVASAYPIPKGRENRMTVDPQVHLGPIAAGVDYGNRDVNAIANTLGQFVYRPAPGGRTQIDDNYAWKAFNDSNYAGKPPGLADALQTLLTQGNVEPLLAAAMPDYGHGRPVHVVLPPQAAPPQQPTRFGF